MNILTVLARHGIARYSDAEAQLAALFERQLDVSGRDIVVVDTALPPGVVSAQPGRTVIGALNDEWEFSAFDAATAFIGRRKWQYDVINFVTSAFGQLYTAYLERFTADVVSQAARQAVCLGHIDYTNEPMEVLGRTSQHWIRTSCFFLPPAELAGLGSFVSTGEASRWFTGDPGAPFREDAPLSDSLKRHVTDWLAGADVGQGVRWHSGIKLEAGTLRYFEQKALAVLNERLLTVRLGEAGCAAIDVTWLSTRLASGAPVDWRTAWEAQIAGRDPAPLMTTASISGVAD